MGANRGGRRMGGFRGRRGQPPRQQPPKKSAEELDRELDAYMKSGKHPRVQPAV